MLTKTRNHTSKPTPPATTPRQRTALAFMARAILQGFAAAERQHQHQRRQGQEGTNRGAVMNQRSHGTPAHKQGQRRGTPTPTPHKR